MTTTPRPPEEAELPRPPVLALALLALTLVATFLCYLILRPFVPVLAWALALAVVAHPAYRWLRRRTRPSLASAAAVLAVAVLIIAPALFAGQRLVRQATQAFEGVGEQIESGEWMSALQEHPRLAALAEWVQEHGDLAGVTESIRSFATENAPAFLTGSIWIVAELLLTLFFLFFFLRDSGTFLDGLRSVLPLSDREVSNLFSRVRDTILATVWAGVATAALQGTLGGLMFWLLGLPAPLVWGFVMFLLCLVPTLGAFLVWTPAAAYLALSGHVGKALILVAWGLGPVALIDNLLYPFLVGTRLRMHQLMAFVAVVGGVFAFGASGLVIGPVVVVVTQALASMWRRRTRRRRSLAAAA